MRKCSVKQKWGTPKSPEKNRDAIRRPSPARKASARARAPVRADPSCSREEPFKETHFGEVSGLPEPPVISRDFCRGG